MADAIRATVTALGAPDGGAGIPPGAQHPVDGRRRLEQTLASVVYFGHEQHRITKILNSNNFLLVAMNSCYLMLL
jgi:hypothetical protein